MSTTFAVLVKPGAKHNLVKKSSREQIDYEISTTARAHDNQANLAVIQLLARELGVKSNQLLLTHGSQAKLKTISFLP